VRVSVSSTFLAVAIATPTLAQAQESGTGLLVLPTQEFERIQEAPVATRGPLPPSATLEAFFPKARSQGVRGSCTAFAAAYSKSYRINLAKSHQGDSDRFLQSPAYIYSALTNGKCDSGTYIHEALQFLRKRGSVDWNEFPYSENSCPDWRAVLRLASHNSYTAFRLSSNTAKSLIQIKSAIADGNPVIVSIFACGEFNRPQAGKVIRKLIDEGKCGPHAVLAVGYDDANQALRIFNSWGSDWGDDGKIWMDYKVFVARSLNQSFVDFGPQESTWSNKTPIWAEDDASVVPSVAVAAPAAPAASATEPPGTTLSPEILARSIRTNIAPSADKISNWSIWLNLPKPLSAQVKRVEYEFDHPTFINPKRSIPQSSIFLAQWKGWGCVDRAKVTAVLTDGSRVQSDFNFCATVGRNNDAIIKIAAIADRTGASGSSTSENIQDFAVRFLTDEKFAETRAPELIKIIETRVIEKVTKFKVSDRQVTRSEAVKMVAGEIAPPFKISYQPSRTTGYYVCINSASRKDGTCSSGRAALSVDNEGGPMSVDAIVVRSK
jgi:hypothetical protein